jgi:putative Holliday junction resolvase
MRILGLDYGDRTVGVAVSDLMGWTAQGVEVIRRKDENHLKPTIERLKEIIEEYKVEQIVVGLPKNMNNTLGERAEKTMRFKEKLELTFGISVVLWDERMSTMFAERTLIEGDVSRKKRKKVIDKMAAIFILQGYLDGQQR